MHDPSEFALKDFQNVCLTSLNSFAPLKKKYVRAHQVSFMNKQLKNAIVVRSKLRNKLLNSRSVTDRKAYNKQTNMCVKLLNPFSTNVPLM